jgi:hypothetical protein
VDVVHHEYGNVDDKGTRAKGDVMMTPSAANRWLEENPPSTPPPKFEPSFMNIVGGSTLPVLRHWGGRVTWDSISRERGMTLLNDHIHLNETSANLVRWYATASARLIMKGWYRANPLP